MTKLNEMTYGELTGQAAKIMVEIRRRAYREGYEQGQLAEREINSCKGEKGFELGEEIGDKLTQIKRDEIVERAKEDIGRFKDSDGLYTVYKGASNDIHHRWNLFATYAECNANFVVNKEKRTVVALLRGYRSGNLYARGIAKCAPNDCFNIHLGKAIALRRALGLDVPSEYLNAPQPTKARVGDIIKFKGHLIEVCDKGITPVRYTKGTCHIGSICADEGKIIDDSREEYSDKYDHSF